MYLEPTAVKAFIDHVTSGKQAEHNIRLSAIPAIQKKLLRHEGFCLSNFSVTQIEGFWAI